MTIKEEIIMKIIIDLSIEMDVSFDEFFDIIDHDIDDLLVGIKSPVTDKVVLYFLKTEDDARFFLPFEIKYVLKR